MVAPAIIGGALAAGGSLLGGWMSNSANREIAAEANALSIELANTQYQRRVEDLKAAGLNPMLAYMQGGAAVPDMKVARQEDIVSPAVASALAAKQNVQQGKILDLQAGQVQAAIQNTQAQTAKTMAETKVVEAGLPYSADIARLNRDEAEQRLTKLGFETAKVVEEANLAEVNYRKGKLDLEQFKAMMPLLQEYQQLINRANQLGMSQAEAESKFFESTGQTSQWVRIFKEIASVLMPNLSVTRVLK